MGPGGQQIDESHATTNVKCLKTQSGWDIIAQPVDTTMQRNGKVVDDPVIKLLSKNVLTYKLDPTGQLKDIVGYKELIETMNSQLPPEIVQKLAPVINSDALKKREAAIWDGRIGDYIGQSVSIGDTWEYEVPYTLPNGIALNYKIKTHFKQKKPCGKSTCVLIEQIYDSAAEGMDDAANQIMASTAEVMEQDKADLPQAHQTGSSIKGKVTRLIDPSTMLIYHEEMERTMKMEMEIPGMGIVPSNMLEKRIYEYNYEE